MRVELIGARLCLEIGTFTGYSALWLAYGLPADGRIICCDIDADASAIAKGYWAEAGLANRCELRLGPALAILSELEREYDAGSFDFAFIDADKQPYDRYYEAALRLVRQGGLILLDNMLWRGRVIDPCRNDSTTLMLRRLNRKLQQDERVSLSMLPFGDGLTIVRKRQRKP